MILALVAAILLAAAILIGTVACLRPHLERALEELCGARHRGDFWSVVCIAALLTGPTICALLLLPLARRDGLHLGIAVLQGTAAGLIGGVTVVSVIALVFTDRLTRGLMPPPVGARAPLP